MRVTQRTECYNPKPSSEPVLRSPRPGPAPWSTFGRMLLELVHIIHIHILDIIVFSVQKSVLSVSGPSAYLRRLELQWDSIKPRKDINQHAIPFAYNFIRAKTSHRLSQR